jgi:hypothetical protein
MLNKKYLIATGCSFTEGHWLGKKASWATYFAANNNLECINLGKGGAGNEFLLTHLIQYCKVNKDIADNAIFGIQLSECLRTLVCLDFPEDNRYPKYWHITPAQFIREDGFRGWDLTSHYNKFIFDNKYALAPFYMNITNSVLITINAIIGFIDFCEMNGYPYFIFDGVSSNVPEKINDKWYLTNTTEEKDIWAVDVEDNKDGDVEFYKHSAKPIIHKKIIDYIASNKYYFRETTCKYYLMSIGKLTYGDNEYYMKDNQGHPNEIGASFWAQYLQNKVMETFGKSE